MEKEAWPGGLRWGDRTGGLYASITRQPELVSMEIVDLSQALGGA